MTGAETVGKADAVRLLAEVAGQGSGAGVQGREQTTGQPPAGTGTVREQTTGQGRWLTLREAAEVAGVSVSALRKAYREERIDSRLEPGPYGEQRLVEVGQVLERVGRGRRPAAAEGEGASMLTDAGAGGGVLVPLDAWQRVMEQLGHLHNAGERLAEARERAARAETEAAFLRERLAELRGRGPVDVDDEAPVVAGPGEAARVVERRRWWRR